MLNIALNGGGIRMGYFCIQPSCNFICLMYSPISPICLLYRVMQDFVQKALFSERQAYRDGLGDYV